MRMTASAAHAAASERDGTVPDITSIWEELAQDGGRIAMGLALAHAGRLEKPGA
jgi:hypothetical protein